MFNLTDLPIPLIAAPMAGGPSTPDLVVNVIEAGGVGFLAGGYKTPEALARQIREVHSRTTGPFGVNVFVPANDTYDLAAVESYRTQLQTTACKYGVEVPTVREFDDDWFDEKIDLVITNRVPVVSLTFGLPPAPVIARLQAAGTHVIATVTTAPEAHRAVASGVDGLCVQGPEAGGHRATFHVGDDPESTPLPALVDDIASNTSLPIIAAGGVGTGARIAELLDRGAAAVQLGTVLVRSPESGAKDAHKAALADPRFTRTVTTRAFSGRPARGLFNSFIAEHDGVAPRAYPQVNHLTSPLRAAAGERGNAQDLALWAGTAFQYAAAKPAATIVRDLWTQARATSGL